MKKVLACICTLILCISPGAVFMVSAGSEPVYGYYAGDPIDNSNLIPKIVDDSYVDLELSGTQFGEYNYLYSPDWVKDLIVVEFCPYYAFADNVSLDYSRWDGVSPGLFTKAEPVLDHLAETGVSAIWVTPVNDRGDSNGYGNLGIHTIDPQLTGTNDYKEGWKVFKKFVEQAHERNIRVFLDVVTWGATGPTPLKEEHPDWFGDWIPGWRGWAYNWKSQGLVDFFKEEMHRIVTDVNVDGFRCDCEPETTGYELFRSIRDAALEAGHKIALFSEAGNDRLNGAYDFDEHMHSASDPEAWTIGDMFLGRYNIVDTIKTGNQIGTDMAQNLGESCEHRFYGFLLECHDQQHGYVGKGNAVTMGYQAILAPFVPIWYMGDEWNNTANGPLIISNFHWDELNDPAHMAVHNTIKQLIRIRRSYPEIFNYFPERLRDTNICKVESTSTLQSYARYADGRAILVVPNYTAAVQSVDFTVPFADAAIAGDSNTVYTVTDLMSGKQLASGTKEQITHLSAAIAGNGLGVFLVDSSASAERTTTTRTKETTTTTKAPTTTVTSTKAPITTPTTATVTATASATETTATTQTTATAVTSATVTTVPTTTVASGEQAADSNGNTAVWWIVGGVGAVVIAAACVLLYLKRKRNV